MEMQYSFALSYPFGDQSNNSDELGILFEFSHC